MIPVERVVVQRLLSKPSDGFSMQLGEVTIYLLKENLLRLRAFTVWVQLLGPVGFLDEGTETAGVLIPM
jgi:hypothetical protein